MLINVPITGRRKPLQQLTIFRTGTLDWLCADVMAHYHKTS